MGKSEMTAVFWRIAQKLAAMPKKPAIKHARKAVSKKLASALSAKLAESTAIFAAGKKALAKTVRSVRTA
jgi:hypothetical protein